ncbi:MAG: serine hydrolase, partial [Planctomycetes bacterium]|nr:serine hydrolase [Planctomycetota bacterium]
MSRLTLLVALAAAIFAPATAAQTYYHGQVLGFHLARYATLKPAGYRLVSIDVAGDLSTQRWSAVWEQGSGADWVGEFGLDVGTFVSWRNTQLAAGYRDQLLTSSGDGTNRVYGAVMVRHNRTSFCYWDLSPTSLQNYVDLHEANGLLMTSLSVHGTAASPRYAAVFVENPERVRWGYTVGDTAAQHQTKFDVFVQDCWARPALVTMSDSHAYATIYTDDQIGEWAARHDMTAAGFNNEVATLGGQGYQPHQIQVGGTGANARYAALFVRNQPAQPVVTLTGQAVPVFDPIDELMIGNPGTRVDGFMQENNVRQAGIAIARNGRLVFARGYTWGVPGVPVTQPTTPFRLASCTKPITAMAIFKLTEQSRTFSTSTYLTNAVPLGTPLDPQVNNIRMFHLLNHTSGYDQGWPWNVTNKLAQAQSSIQTQMLDFAPGSQTVYSNAAYQMLGVVVEQQSGQSYLNFVRQNLLLPLGVFNCSLHSTAPVANHVRCQEGGWGGSRLLQIGASAVLPGNPLVNRAYSFSPLHGDASGGLMLSPVDYVRLLSGVFDQDITASVFQPTTRTSLEAMIQQTGRTGGWDFSSQRSANGVPYKYYEKGGLWMSAHTYVVRRTDGISMALFNTGPGAIPVNDVNNLIDQITAWPQHDLFPNYGLAAFPRTSPGSVTAFGASCPGSNGLPTHTSIGLPEVGFAQDFLLGSGPASSVALLLLGIDNTQYNGQRLPAGLG